MAACQTHKSNTGFTLIEVLITVILVGTLIAISGPIGSVVETYRMDYLNQKLFNSASLARSESIKRGVNVSLCRSVSGSNCDVSDSNWADGWIVFTDINDNNSVESGSGEEVLRIYPAMDSSLKLTWNAGDRVRFVPRGNIRANGNFALCIIGRTAGPIKKVFVMRTGRVRKETDTGNCL